MATPPVVPEPALRPSVCPLDCPDTCSLCVEVVNDRVVQVRGSRANPFTAGAVCSKVATLYPEFVHGPTRLTRPLVRTGARGSTDDGAFAAIGWSEALERVHDGLTRVIDAHGPQAVVPFNYAGPHGYLAGGSMDRRFFHRLGASLLDRGPLCGGIRSRAWTSLFGAMPGMGPEQAEHAQLVIVWSNNVTVSNLHFARVVTQAKRRGAKVVVIDPRRIQIARQADLHLAPRPGTDVALALGLAAELERLGALDHAFLGEWAIGTEAYLAAAREWTVERTAKTCGLAADDIRTFARWFAERNPVAVSVGNGMERSRTGGASFRAALALSVLTGRFGTPGNGVITKAGNAFPSTSDRLTRPDFIPPGTRTLNILDVPGLILDGPDGGAEPPVRGLFIYNHNPLATHPDQQRMRRALDHQGLFTVGCDVSMTDSMRYADVILPASSHFEFADLYAAYGQQWLQRAEPVINPVGESAPNTEIFRRLAARFGFDDPAFKASDAELMDDAVNGDDPRLGGHRPSELPLAEALAMRIDGEPATAFRNVFPSTPSGKVELYSAELEAQYGEGLPRFVDTHAPGAAYPLALITPSSSDRTNATFGGCDANLGVPPLDLHPTEAAARRLKEGQSARVHNAMGSVQVVIHITDEVTPGVAYSPKGTWLATSSTGQTVNALVPDLRSDIADGACFNNTFVEVEANM